MRMLKPRFNVFTGNFLEYDKKAGHLKKTSNDQVIPALLVCDEASFSPTLQDFENRSEVRNLLGQAKNRYG